MRAPPRAATPKGVLAAKTGTILAERAKTAYPLVKWQHDIIGYVRGRRLDRKSVV